jgi:biotin synthase
VEPRKLMDADEIVTRARQARESGATRFCLGAAWRSPTDGQVEKVCQAVRGVADLGLETCVTLGMITAG